MKHKFIIDRKVSHKTRSLLVPYFINIQVEIMYILIIFSIHFTYESKYTVSHKNNRTTLPFDLTRIFIFKFKNFLNVG